jgi:poly [ADP-ribose] polymerase 2/3/4
MSNKQYAKLIMVTPDNNNKYYEMTWDGGANFTVKYGRVESTATTVTYPYSKWTSKYNEKIRKGYKDVTDMVSVAITEVKNGVEKFVDIADRLVNEFMTKMKAYTDGLVSKTYSVKAEAVSQKQVDEAQKLIDSLKLYDGTRSTYSAAQTKVINKILTDLYTVIPRKMGNVRDYLLPSINIQDILEDEQDNLDAMAAQVSMIKPADNKKAKADKKKAQTLLDKLGLTMTEFKGTPKEVEYLTKQAHGRKVKVIFEVNKPSEDAEFNKWLGKQKDKKTSILIHGTRCSSVVPILEIGLKIRPAGNFQFSGKAYGDGNYFSEHMQKSLGYTGYDSDKVILVYEVHTGNPFVYNGWYSGNSFPLNYSELKKRGYDSTYVKPGNGLQNSEIIAYNEEQNRIKYIIWLT